MSDSNIETVSHCHQHVTTVEERVTDGQTDSPHRILFRHKELNSSRNACGRRNIAITDH
jgi:hypothetical protein